MQLLQIIYLLKLIVLMNKKIKKIHYNNREKGGFFMWLKNKKINLLEKSIENLSQTLQKGNFVEWAYLLRK